MGRVLVIANETLRSDDLHDLVRARADRGQIVRYVVPLRIPMYADLGGLSMYGFVALEPGDADAIERDGWSRLEEAIRRLEGEGVRASGRVYCADPLTAVERELAQRGADEIILSTKARAISRWLGVDLPRRLARRFPEVTITTLENAHRAEAVIA